MKDKLSWLIKGEIFEDGSTLNEWAKVYQSPDWHWQYDTHEMTFAIYEHDGQFWKLYQARYVVPGEDSYTFGYGGVACRMVLVEYRKKFGSPHSSRLMEKSEQEWIRTYEFDPTIHKVLKMGEENQKYGKPYESKLATSSLSARDFSHE